MFIAQPHSFTQQARLAITLSWIGGYTNMIALLTCGQAVSHVTGTASNLGGRLAGGEFFAAAFAAMLLVTFGIGAMASGFMLEYGRARRWSSLYVWPMAVEAGLLAVFATLVELHEARGLESGAVLWLMAGLAALAMGLQNATITRISDGVVRTTHVTGVVTDIGLEGAQAVTRWVRWVREQQPCEHPPPQGRQPSPSLADGPARRQRGPASMLLHAGSRKVGDVIRGRRPEGAPTTLKRLALLFTILLAFGFGTFVGALVFGALPQWSMIPPVLLLLWVVVQDLRVPIADVRMLTPHQVATAVAVDLHQFDSEPERRSDGPIPIDRPGHAVPQPGATVAGNDDDDDGVTARVLSRQIAVYRIGGEPARSSGTPNTSGGGSLRPSRWTGFGPRRRAERMPDLLAWAALHVPVDVRVIVLDMTAFASTGGFDAAACIEVLTLARAVDLTPGAAPFGPAPGVGVLAVPSARNDHRVKPPPMPTPASASAHASDPASGPEPPRRHLVLGGITPAMRMQLRAAGVMRHLEARNLCRTPGLAVARAIMLLERATPVTDGT